MKPMIAILGAAALSLATGAIVGSAIPTEPLSSGSSLADLSPPPMQRYDAAVQDAPNHYPLKTARGVVPVEELSMHGLYRDRYRPFHEAAVYVPEDELTLVEMAELAEPIEIVPLPEPRHARDYAESGARMIDVAGELLRLR